MEHDDFLWRSARARIGDGLVENFHDVFLKQVDELLDTHGVGVSATELTVKLHPLTATLFMMSNSFSGLAPFAGAEPVLVLMSSCLDLAWRSNC